MFFIRFISPLIDNWLLSGVNSIILAYGQTGSGKSYTMVTSKNEFGDIIPGVIQRTVEKIINSNRSNQYGFSFKMKLIEIYKNQFKDLLVADETYMRIGGNLALRNKMSMSASVEIENLDQVMATYGKAVSNLRTTGTKMNDFSSRSHLIIVIESNHPVRGTSKLFIVDLAGSERSFRVGGNSATLDEGNHINKDLTDLGIYAWQE